MAGVFAGIQPSKNIPRISRGNWAERSAASFTVRKSRTACSVSCNKRYVLLRVGQSRSSCRRFSVRRRPAYSFPVLFSTGTLTRGTRLITRTRDQQTSAATAAIIFLTVRSALTTVNDPPRDLCKVSVMHEFETHFASFDWPHIGQLGSAAFNVGRCMLDAPQGDACFLRCNSDAQTILLPSSVAPPSAIPIVGPLT